MFLNISFQTAVKSIFVIIFPVYFVFVTINITAPSSCSEFIVFLSHISKAV